MEHSRWVNDDRLSNKSHVLLTSARTLRILRGLLRDLGFGVPSAPPVIVLRPRLLTISPPPIKAAIFDLDGTLIDSAPDIAAAVNKVLTTMGTQALPVSQVEQFIGEGIQTLLERALSYRGLPTDANTIERALQGLRTNYEAAPFNLTRLYPHVLEDLQTLSAAGLRLGICTNKLHHLTQLVVASSGLGDLIEVALGADAVPEPKPHPGHLLAVLAQMDVQPHECVYVGDMLIDRACALAAAVPFYLVGWSRDLSLAPSPERVLTRLADLGLLLNASTKHSD